jgi:hypothetical protein
MTGKEDSQRPLSPLLDPELDAEIKKVLAEKEFSNLEELNREVGSIVERHNKKPKDDFGGLSPVQVTRLIYSDWTSPDSAIQLEPSLTFEELGAARILINARLFLNLALDEGGIKATATGNLTRKFVETMLDNMALRDGHAELVRIVNKVINEEDLFPLHVLRILLVQAGLARRTKGFFRVTKKGRALLSKARAGELYALLFFTMFRRFNLAYLSRGPEQGGVQETIAYALYRFSRSASGWRNAETLAEELLLPTVVERLDPPDYPGHVLSLCESRIFNPLEEFGLLERRKLPSDEKLRRPYEVRKTELFDRFLKFKL